ncbi:MAG: phosphate-starvation-inducible PsiE family protein [Halodesulfurarchaeum sp.]
MAEGDTDRRFPPTEESPSYRISQVISRFVDTVELAAAGLFALLFGIGVVDLAWQIAKTVPSGAITDPLVVIGFIETGLLLLIIVEVYQTVVAYLRQNDTREIVRLVIYTGVIAMVRKVIIFRASEYPNVESALLAAIAYTVIILGLVSLLFVERRLDSTGSIREGLG